MNAIASGNRSSERGAGLVEIMISVVIGMLMVLVIYQVYSVNEAQKRTITSGSDAQVNASYGLFLLSQDISVAGNAVAKSASALEFCAPLRPIPVLINGGGGPNVPDSVTVFYGGSATLSSPVLLLNSATGTNPYIVTAPVGFSAGDVIAAVQGATCTLSKINAGGVAVNPVSGQATLTRTVLPGSSDQSYVASSASVVNLGQAASLGRVVYSVDANCPTDATKCALRTQNLISTTGGPNPVVPVIGDVVNLKAQYGLDTDNDGIVDTWQEATGAVWSAANLPAQPLATWQQIRAVRIAIVTRSTQYERDVVSPASLTMFAGADAIADGATAVTMTLTPADPAQHYRYKVLETVIPLRNAMWNAP
jgi:type IV pilus assembly protein PilW